MAVIYGYMACIYYKASQGLCRAALGLCWDCMGLGKVVAEEGKLTWNTGRGNGGMHRVWVSVWGLLPGETFPIRCMLLMLRGTIGNGKTQSFKCFGGDSYCKQV